MNTEIVKALTKTQEQTLLKMWHEVNTLTSREQLKFCVKLAEDQYHGKQKIIAELLGISKQAVSQMVTIGEAEEKYTSSILLPEGWRSLYEMSCLTEKQIAELCRDGPPTQKQIYQYKVRIGKIKAAPKPEPKAKDSKEYVSEMYKLLVPDRDRATMSTIGWRGFMDRAKDIAALMEKLNKQMQKDTLRLLVKITYQMERHMQAQVRKEVEIQVAETKARLKVKEDDLDRQHARAVGLKSRISENDIKLIQGCLHPDREASASRKAKAFDVFRRAF
jgi:predicted transcriptional regulator